ncbi:hypothetical protein NDU88_007274 [Pleurodeles waltl]|uniref:Uncharacterized protein n=1 Tax=Pleurodeles waltl TaxID=8319 RepID=A0AAV7UPM6_PLEWA|nr:hypothetical protein NDU88_007274 [Pleurodeles waltl]
MLRRSRPRFGFLVKPAGPTFSGLVSPTFSGLGQNGAPCACFCGRHNGRCCSVPLGRSRASSEVGRGRGCSSSTPPVSIMGPRAGPEVSNVAGEAGAGTRGARPARGPMEASTDSGGVEQGILHQEGEAGSGSVVQGPQAAADGGAHSVRAPEQRKARGRAKQGWGPSQPTQQSGARQETTMAGYDQRQAAEGCAGHMGGPFGAVWEAQEHRLVHSGHRGKNPGAEAGGGGGRRALGPGLPGEGGVFRQEAATGAEFG